MKVVNKTYKFRLYPNAEQEVLLSKHFGCSRFVFNYFLNERKEQYKKDKKIINQDLKLSDREWTCKCGETHDRYLNTSKNILKEGLKIYGKGLAITKMESKLDFYKEAYSMKPETHWSLANV